ncbi:MAG: hypothetical protein VW804_00255, partial [Verrucomicrobiota bacterium]
MRPNRQRKLIGLLLTWMTIWPGVLVTGESTPPQTQASGITLQLDLSTLHHLELLEASEDSWSLRSTGSDPYVTLEPLPLAAKGSKQVVLSFETFCPQGLDDLELFFGPP